MKKALNYLSLLGELSAFMVSFSVIIYKMMLKYSKLINDLGTTPNHFIRNVIIHNNYAKEVMQCLDYLIHLKKH